MAKPTHYLCVKKKDGGFPNVRIGVAWQNDKGWFNVRLNPCVVLTDRDDVYIGLYPIIEESKNQSIKPDVPVAIFDDEIPF